MTAKQKRTVSRQMIRAAISRVPYNASTNEACQATDIARRDAVAKVSPNAAKRFWRAVNGSGDGLSGTINALARYVTKSEVLSFLST